MLEVKWGREGGVSWFVDAAPILSSHLCGDTSQVWGWGSRREGESLTAALQISQRYWERAGQKNQRGETPGVWSQD